MKKILPLLLCLVLTLALAACTPSETSSEQKLKELQNTYEFVGEIGTSGKYIVSNDLGVNAKYGLCNIDGKLIFDLEYDSFMLLKDDTFLVLKDGKYALLKTDGSVLFDYKYKEAFADPRIYFEDRIAEYVMFYDESGCVCVDLNGTPLTDVFSSRQVYSATPTTGKYIVQKGDELFMLSIPEMTTAKIENGFFTSAPVAEGSDYYFFEDSSKMPTEPEDKRYAENLGVKDKDGKVILEPIYNSIRFIHTEEKDFFIASRNMLNNAALYDMEGNRISEEYEHITFLEDHFEAKVDEDIFVKLDFSGNVIESQAELRQKFEDGIKITQTSWEAKEENIEDFPFDMTFYRTGDDPKDSYGHPHFQLMFKLKEEFSEYSTYKIRISYYDEELCNSGEYSSEDIFSTTVAAQGRPYHISFELSGEGLETIVSGKVDGEDLWSFGYFYDDVSNNEGLDASKPIKIMLSDMGSLFF